MCGGERREWTPSMGSEANELEGLGALLPPALIFDDEGDDACQFINYSRDRSPTSWHNALRSNHGNLGCTPRFAHPGVAPSAWARGTMTITRVTEAVNTPYGIAKNGILHEYAQKKANHWGDGLGSGDVG